MANNKGKLTDHDFAVQARAALGVETNDDALAALQESLDRDSDTGGVGGAEQSTDPNDKQSEQEQASDAPRDPNNPTAEETMRAATGKPPQQRNIP